jgi:multidrug efflux pump subunit AcrA (membrane-fusion protein)
MNSPEPLSPAPAPQEHHADVGSAPPVTPVSTRRMVTAGIVVAVILAVLLITSWLPRHSVSKELAAEVVGDDAPPVVQIAAVHRGAEGGGVELPGTIQALHESAVYARVAGYVKSWRADIGNVVHTGDILAEIDAPEVTQEVTQAEHQLAQSRAATGLAQTDLARWKILAKDSAVTRQELDQKQAAYDAAVANDGAAAANHQRLVEMQNFTRVRAPFTGVVTARNVDIGSLITAAGATSAPVAGGDVLGAQGPGSLFRIAQTDTVRTYIAVPESYSTAMAAGLAARVTVQELPGRTFTGRVVRTSHAIDVASRTLLTEVDIANPGFVLLPGMFSNVQVQFPHMVASLVVPATALVIRSAGTQVMVFDSVASVVHLKSVTVGRDYGASIEILRGIVDGTVIVTNPSADISEGMKVKVGVAAVEKK